MYNIITTNDIATRCFLFDFDRHIEIITCNSDRGYHGKTSLFRLYHNKIISGKTHIFINRHLNA